MYNIEEHLARMAWNDKTVASGKADSVPEALRGLTSPDERIRQKSYWQLDNEVVLQSDLYEAAYFIIPILIGMLQDRVSYGRDLIYDLLYEIANGYAPADIVCRTVDGQILPLMDACNRELKRGMDVFLRDSADGDPTVRDKSRELLSLLNPDIATSPSES